MKPLTPNRPRRVAPLAAVALLALTALLAPALAAKPPKGKAASATDISRNLAVFNQLYKELNTFYVDTIDASKAIETAITAMLDEIDPYTEFIPESGRDAFARQTKGEYAGIGSFIQTRGADTYISGPQEGSPSQKAGLRPGDRIVTVDGDSMHALNAADVSERLRGQAGTKVKVGVVRPWLPEGADSVLEFEITRAKILEPSVVWSGIINPDKGIGYIYLSSFTERSPQEVKDAMQALLTWPGGLNGLVLDLRGNGGGLVESAARILGFFLPKGQEVLRQRGREALHEKVYKTTGQALDTQVPVAVLIDGGTASAAEIVAGAMQDLDRAVVVGNRSFGKGLVQTSRQLPYDNLLKVTIAKYFLPSGRLVQAIDYSRRNPDGSVARIPDSLTNVFHTRAGREVRDGGGITPDVTVELPDMTRLVWNLVRDNWIFDYANRYRAANDTLRGDAATFALTDQEYADFKATIDPARFSYDRVCETILDQLREAAKAEGYLDPQVSASIDSLQTLLHHDLGHDLDANRPMVEDYLVPEIVERYLYQRGRARASLRNDTVLNEAIAILASPERYSGLLKPAKGGKQK